MKKYYLAKVVKSTKSLLKKFPPGTFLILDQNNQIIDHSLNYLEIKSKFIYLAKGEQ